MRPYVLFTIVLAALFSFTLPVELEVKSLLDDKIEIKIPKGFTVMEKEMLELKYPGPNRPRLVYTNERGSINVAFNHTTSRASQDLMETYKGVLKNAFQSAHKNAVILGDGIKEVNGRNVGYFELITQAVDTKVYNLIFFTDLEGRLLLCTFNCTEKNLEEWKNAGSEIFASLKIMK